MTEVLEAKAPENEETNGTEEASEHSPAQELPSCSCGHTRESLGKSVDVSIRNEYSLVGWSLIVFGITARPTKVKWYCSQCSSVIDETTDPKALYRYS